MTLRKMKMALAGLLAAAMAATCMAPASAAGTSLTSAPAAETQASISATQANGLHSVVNTSKNGTAALSKVRRTSETNVRVAAKVEVNGVKYALTTINSNAFAKCAKATRIRLPYTVTKIRKNAFKGAKRLRTLVINSKKSVTVKKGAFSGLNTKKMTIKVTKNMSKRQFRLFKKELKKAGFKGKVKQLA